MVLGIKTYLAMLLMGVALLGVPPLEANANSPKLEICLLENNLPYSIQIVGRFGEDEKLLQISKVIEKSLKPPPLLNSWELC